MPRKLDQNDPQFRERLEWGVLDPILSATGEASGRILAIISAILPQPLFQWFDAPNRRGIALALDAALRGDCKSDSQSVAGYLAGLPHATMHEMLTGKPVMPWTKVDHEGSALLAIGGYNELAPSVAGLSHAPSMASSSAQTLRHLVERQRAVEVLRDVATEVARSDLTKGPGDHIGLGIDRLSGLLSGGVGARNLGDCLDSAIEAAKLAASLRDDGRGSPCSWGIPELDALCPLRPGMLVVLSAPPGAGKTSLALQSASTTAAAGGKGSVALVSLEMTGEEVATILAAHELGISPSAIREWTPVASDNEEMIRACSAQWRASDAMMVRDLDAGGQRQTAQSVTAWMRQRKTISNNRLALGIVDYLGLLDGESKGREYDTLTQATRSLKRAALTLRLPLLVLAQMNREGHKADRDKSGAVAATPEPRLEDLRGSGSIEQDADAVVFIHLPDAKTENGNKQGSLRGQIIVAKHRGGSCGRIDVVFHKRQQLFVAVPPVDRGDPDRMATAPSESEDMFG